MCIRDSYNGPPNAKDFCGALPGSIVIDRCKIYKDKFRNKGKLEQPAKKYVGIGFWAAGMGTTPADTGQLQMGNRRLLVGELSQDGIVKVEPK